MRNRKDMVEALLAAPSAHLRVRPRWWHFLPLLALMLVTVIFGSRAFASYPADVPTGQGYGPAHDFMVAQRGAPANPDPKSSNRPIVRDAYMEFVPGAAGTCPAPPNGGTTQVGCTFDLDLM